MVSVSTVITGSCTFAASHTRCRKTHCSCNNCRATVRCNDARNRQNTLWPGSPVTFSTPVSIGSLATKRMWLRRENPM